MAALSDVLLTQWQQIRRLTYDYLDGLEPSHLALTLPFPKSQSLGYQFWCMAGAQESYLEKLEHGRWQGFSSSLSHYHPLTPAVIKQQLQRADEDMVQLLQRIDLEAPLADGQPGYNVVLQMIKHEMHHHGQLINFMFCFQWPIPQSWQNEWALAYDE